MRSMSSRLIGCVYFLFCVYFVSNHFNFLFLEHRSVVGKIIAAGFYAVLTKEETRGGVDFDLRRIRQTVC